MSAGDPEVKDNRPELVIGLIGAIGVDLDAVEAALEKALATVEYRTRRINVIELLPNNSQWKPLGPLKSDVRYHKRMDAGNKFREALKRNDAFALLAMSAIRDERMEVSGDHDKSIPHTAFFLHSLKTKKEVERLRETYGPNCLIVAAYAPRENRVKRLAQKIAASYHSEWSRQKDRAEQLVVRDENERGRGFGQNVRDTFPLADVFLDASDPEGLERDALRFIEVLFSHPFRTPTRDEFGMFQAYGAALRSSSAGRQVGAAVATVAGDVVALGTNEVAKAFGGQYWEGDKNDQRDHRRPNDSSHEMRQNILADLLSRLKKLGWLDPAKGTQTIEDLLDAADEEQLLGKMVVDEGELASLGDKALITGLIEFIRAVHAEMAAIASAAQRGASVNGCVLYSTSFPCHECARHIVAAGITRVAFIEPYPKSRVVDLFDDSIAVDSEDCKRVPFRAFTGIAPRVFLDFFAMPERTADDGRWVDWNVIKNRAKPRLANPPNSYLEKEQDWVLVLTEEFKAQKISWQT